MSIVEPTAENTARRFAVFSTGHSGSSWATMVLRACNVPAFHEPLINLIDARHRLPLIEGVDGAARDEMLAGYRRWRDARVAESDVVGEVHTTHANLWPVVLEELAPRRALLVRNPVQVTHSMARVVTDETDEVSATYGPTGLPADVLAGSPSTRLFGIACAHWAKQAELLNALHPITAYRLEDVTADAPLMRAFLRTLTGVEPPNGVCEELGAHVVNRKVSGDRSPENLFWNRWDAERRALFVRLCGDALQPLGYALPERPSLRVDGGGDSNEGEPSRGDEREAPPRSLRSLWAFRSRPAGPAVLVVGNGPRAALSARLLHPRPAYLLRTSATPWPTVPDGLVAVEAEDVDVIGARAVYIVPDVNLDGAALARSASSVAEPTWEVASAFSEDPADAPAPTPAGEGGAVVRRTWAGVAVGDAFDGWRVARIERAPDRVSLRVRRDDGEAELRATPPGRGRPGPVPCLDGTLAYFGRDASFDALRPVLEGVARVAGRSGQATILGDASP